MAKKECKMTPEQAQLLVDILLGASLSKLVRKLPPGTELVIKKVG